MTEREQKATDHLVSQCIFMAAFLASLRHEATHSRDFTVTITAEALEANGQRFDEAVDSLMAARMQAILMGDRKSDVVP